MIVHDCLIRAYVDTLRELRKRRDSMKREGGYMSDNLNRQITINEDLLRQLLPLEYKEF